MSYDPPSYLPPGYPPGPYQMDCQQSVLSEANPPARRAAIMMWGLGALMLICGLCLGMLRLIPADQLMANMGRNAPPGMTVDQLIQQSTAVAVFLLALSLLLIILAFFVYRGGQASSIVALVVCSLFALLLALNLLTSLGIVMQNPMVALGIGIMLVPLALFVITIVWLSQAIREGPGRRLLQQQMQAQLLAYQQAQQAGYGGYGPPPPPAAMAPFPPPAPTPDASRDKPPPNG